MNIKFLLSLLVFYLFTYCNCLYEDQISKWDFRQRFIGKMEHITTHLSQLSHTIIVGSEINVISSIHLRNGTINWRHILEKCKINTIAGTMDERTDEQFERTRIIEKNSQLISINCNGYYIRNWNAITGSLNWEKTLPSHIVEESEINNDNYIFHVKLSTNEIYIAKYDDKASNLIIYSFNYKTDIIKSILQTNLPLYTQKFTESCHFINDRYFLCVNKDRLSIDFLQVDSSQMPSSSSLKNEPVTVPLKSVKLSSFGLQANEKPSSLNLVTFPNLMYTSTLINEKPYIAINLGGQGFIILQLNANEINLVKILPNVKKIYFEQINKKTKGDDLNLFIFALISKPDELKTSDQGQAQTNMVNEQFKVAVFNLNDWNEEKTLSGHFNLRLSSVKDVDKWSILPFIQGDKFYYKILISTVDGLLVLTSTQGKISWKREESLSNIISAEIMDLPLSELDATIESTLGIDSTNIITQFLNRISSQALQLQTYLTNTFDAFYTSMFVQRKSDDENNGDDDETSINNGYNEITSTSGNEIDIENDKQLYRDKFGMHKVIVVLTKSGKLFGIDTLNGKYLWSFYDENLGSDLAKSNRKQRIFIQRTTAHYPFPARCSIVTDNGYIVSFNPINGKIYDKLNLNVHVKQVMMLSHFDDEFLKGLIIVDNDNKIHLYPSGEINMKNFLQHKSNYYLVNGNEKTGLIEGYSFIDYTNVNHQATRVWSLELPFVNEQLNNSSYNNNRLQMIFKRYNEHVHSQGRVLGDRSVLYKYLNPNVVLIIYEGLEGDTLGKQNNYISLYLIDGVTGSIIYSTIHKRSKGPVYAVHSENSIVYSYYNEKYRRTEISSIELYEGSTLNSDPFSSLKRLSLRPKIIEHQNFIFPTGILSMSDTITDKGITNKHLLIALPSGGVLELPKAFVDPRRPIHPTPDHREEGLIPYVPELPVPSEGIINYNKSLTNIHTIVTAPSSLESTCLVFMYGLDIFYTRVTPSKTFDILKDDFDHWLIAGVLTILILLSYLSKYLAAKKSLNNAWK